MNRLIFKGIVFLLIVVVLGCVNSYLRDVPLFEHNTEMAVKQFDGKNLTNVGDFTLLGYSFTMNTVYIFEALFLVAVGSCLFVTGIVNALFGSDKPKS